MSPESQAFVVFSVGMLVLMGIGMNMGLALVLTGAGMAWVLNFWDTQLLAQNLVAGVDSFPLLAVPFFILAGELMNAGGISRRIIDMAQAWVGHIRGGLGYVAIAAAVLMASMSGSALADTAALATILLPMMRQQGYPMATSGGLIASGGIIAPIIPPSIGFVIFGVAANVSISKLFLAGIVPGLLMGLSIAVAWWYVSRRENVTPPPKASTAERLRALKDSTWAMGLPVIVVVGLKMGVFTPTEAAVVAAVYALFVSIFVYRELKPRDIYAVFVASAKTSAVVMFLIAAAMVSSWLITVADLPGAVVSLLQPFMDSPILLMAAIMVLVMVVGTAMDMTPTILILTPVLVPVVIAAGIDPIYFGVLFVINNAIGLVTPPVGTTLNVVCGVTKRSMDDAIVGVIPFMIAQLIVLALLVIFPDLVIVPMKWLSGM